MAVDVTRGVALLGMLAANVFDPLNSNGTPSIAVMTVIGRSATLFAFVAGLTLALTTGGRHPVQGPAQAAAAGLAVRALLIATIGLALGNLDASGNVDVILAYYGMFFLLAIPLIGLKPRTLACIAGGLVVVAPLAVLVTFRPRHVARFLWLRSHAQRALHQSGRLGPAALRYRRLSGGCLPDLHLCGSCHRPGDFSSIKVAVRLLAGGAALAAAAWEASWVLLFPLGGIHHLQRSDPGTPARLRTRLSGFE